MSMFLVTGGAGFIGSHLVEALLASGNQVRVLDDLSTGKRGNIAPGAELIVGDVSDADTVRSAMAGADGCFHLAAIASVVRCNDDWVGASRVNLGGSVCVFDAARRAGGVPVVYASSAAVYGALDGVAAEDSPTVPRSAYGADKLGLENHARAGALVHGVSSVGLRFFNVYGPRQDPSSPYSGVISLFAAALLARRGIVVNGDGQQTRDFIYVADIVDFLSAAMQSAQGSCEALVLNACTGRQTSILDLAHTLAEQLQLRPDIEFASARPGDIRHSRGDPRTATAVLGLSAGTALSVGLGLTMRDAQILERA